MQRALRRGRWLFPSSSQPFWSPGLASGPSASVAAKQGSRGPRISPQSSCPRPGAGHPGPPCSAAAGHIWTPVTADREAYASRSSKQACRNGLLVSTWGGARALGFQTLSPRAPALHLLCKFDRVTGEPAPKLGVQVGSRGDLDHLLVPPLDGAVSLVQVQDVPVLVPWGGGRLRSAPPGTQTPLSCWRSPRNHCGRSARLPAVAQPGQKRAQRRPWARPAWPHSPPSWGGSS